MGGLLGSLLAHSFFLDVSTSCSPCMRLLLSKLPADQRDLVFCVMLQTTAGSPRPFHTITSAQGAAVHWQVRIHYYW